MEASNNVVISGNEVTAAGRQGVFLVTTQAVSLNSNLFLRNRDRGMTINRCSEIRIANNYASGNLVSGVEVTDSRDAIVEMNIIGIAKGGMADPNHLHGLVIRSCKNTVVRSNVISGNRGSGLLLIDLEGVNRISVIRNIIGVAPDGQSAIPNGRHGLDIYGSADVTIGGQGAGNVISANNGSGVHMVGSRRVQLLSNHIGTSDSMLDNLGNAGDGILVDACTGVSIGSVAHGETLGNVIAHNNGTAINAKGAKSPVQVLSNRIFGNADGAFAPPEFPYNLGLETKLLHANSSLVRGEIFVARNYQPAENASDPSLKRALLPSGAYKVDVYVADDTGCRNGTADSYSNTQPDQRGLAGETIFTIATGTMIPAAGSSIQSQAVSNGQSASFVVQLRSTAPRAGYQPLPSPNSTRRLIAAVTRVVAPEDLYGGGGTTSFSRCIEMTTGIFGLCDHCICKDRGLEVDCEGAQLPRPMPHVDFPISVRKLSLSAMDFSWASPSAHFAQESLDKFASITHLDICRSQLSAIPSRLLNHTRNLETLDMSRNDFASLTLSAFDAVALHQLSALRVLDLSASGMLAVPERLIKGMARLEILDLSDNAITTLQGLQWPTNGQLHTLVLSANRVKSLSLLNLRSLAYLRTLRIEDNFIHGVVAGDLDNATVADLHLQRNRIERVGKGGMRGLTQLRFLDLSDNPLSSIEASAFSRCATLQHMALPLQTKKGAVDHATHTFRASNTALAGTVQLSSVAWPSAVCPGGYIAVSSSSSADGYLSQGENRLKAAAGSIAFELSDPAPVPRQYCLRCPQGHQVQGSECKVLSPPWTDHDGDASTPAESCPNGTYVPIGATGLCRDYLCPAGTTDADNDPSSECVQCVSGHYSASGAAGECKRCPQNSTDHDGDAATLCTICSNASCTPDRQVGPCLCHAANNSSYPALPQTTSPPDFTANETNDPCSSNSSSGTRAEDAPGDTVSKEGAWDTLGPVFAGLSGLLLAAIIVLAAYVRRLQHLISGEAGGYQVCPPGKSLHVGLFQKNDRFTTPTSNSFAPGDGSFRGDMGVPGSVSVQPPLLHHHSDPLVDPRQAAKLGDELLLAPIDGSTGGKGQRWSVSEQEDTLQRRPSDGAAVDHGRFSDGSDIAVFSNPLYDSTGGAEAASPATLPSEGDGPDRRLSCTDDTVFVDAKVDVYGRIATWALPEPTSFDLLKGKDKHEL